MGRRQAGDGASGEVTRALPCANRRRTPRVWSFSLTLPPLTLQGAAIYTGASIDHNRTDITLQFSGGWCQKLDAVEWYAYDGNSDGNRKTCALGQRRSFSDSRMRKLQQVEKL